MTSFARQVINALLPRGSAWSPKYDGGFDRLLNGIADCFATLKTVAGGLADLRHPLVTQQLEDLEREFGVVTEAVVDAKSRRVYLHGVVYGDLGTGSDDNLEARLAAAGFTDVQIHQNDPVIDPSAWLMAGPICVCGGATAVCGHASARCGFGGGYLLVNGAHPDDTSYPLTADSHFWPFVFFVGGDRTGWEFFIDWNMEHPDAGAWTPGGGAALSKSQAVYYPGGGIRSLTIKAEAADVTEQQVQADNTDADLLSFYRMHDNKGLCANEARLNLLHDGNMERNGVAAWTPTTATLTKQTGAPYSGTRCLRIVGDPGERGWGGQEVLAAGRTYTIRGKARSHDGAAAPAIRWGIHRILTHSDVVPRTAEIRVMVPAGMGYAMTIHWGDGDTTAVVCNGVLNTYTHAYPAGTWRIGLSGDWREITRWTSISQSWLYGDLADFADMVDLQRLYLYNTGCTGDIANLAGMALTVLNLSGTGCTGDIVNLAGMPLTHLNLYNNTGVTGDIANLAGMALVELYLYNTGCTGDIANLAGMALTVLNLSGTGCTGDIVNLAGMPLTHLYLYSTGCTYPVAGMVQPLAWRTANIQCYNCAWTTAMVDQMLIDHDAIAVGGYASNLSIAGTNAARTNPGAGENARASLVAKGKTVTVN